VGDRPAITRSAQQIDLRNGVLLYDTPGILWPNLVDQEGAYRLAASGAIGDTAIDFQEVARFAADLLLRTYPDLLRQRFKLDPLPLDGGQLLLELGRRRGCLETGGEINLYRAADILLRELQAGKIGRISFENPEETQASIVEKGL
jgi:ribosome biogenesis GTPase A